MLMKAIHKGNRPSNVHFRRRLRGLFTGVKLMILAKKTMVFSPFFLQKFPNKKGEKNSGG